MLQGKFTAPFQLISVPYLFKRGVVMSLLTGGLARAEEPVPHEGERALPSIIAVGVPVPASEKVAFAASAGYGYFDRALDLQDPGHRLRGSISGALAVTPFLMLGADASGHIDLFSGADDDELNLYGEPRLTGRLHLPASDNIFWGAQVDTRLVGGDAPDIDFGATSPSLRGLFGARLASTTWLGAELGFHFDNSAHTLSNPELISSADRITVGASSFSAIPWGVGVSHRLDLGLELLGEIRGEVLIGNDAPAIFESPWGMSVGARHPVMRQLDIMFSADVSLSGRPDWDPDAFVPIEPRIAGLVTAVFRPGPKASQNVPPPEPKTEAETELNEPEEAVVETPEVVGSTVGGTVIDEGGRPIPDAEVTLGREGEQPVVERTYESGAFEFKNVPEGPVELTIKTPGYDEAKHSFKEGEERTREVVLYPSLPAGQVKGEVRDLKGNPIAVKITITPGDKVIEVSKNGTFELELAPGRYTVRFEHPELAPQQRVISVQDRGVVILNIALSQ